jgi:hypothetical protein
MSYYDNKDNELQNEDELRSEFYDCIQHNNSSKLIKILKNKNLHISSEDDNYALFQSAENGNLNIVEILLKDYRLDPAHAFNRTIKFAAQKGHYDVVELLLKDKRVNPADYSNEAIKQCYNKEHMDIVYLLWNDQRIKDTLQNDNQPLYKLLIQQDIKTKIKSF